MNVSRRELNILLIVGIGNFLGFLNQTLMNTALPSIMREFSISASQGQWLSNGYMLINGVMIPLTAFLMDRFKTKHLYLTAMSMFTIGTVVAGFAPDFWILILGRMFQAAGTGILIPLMNVITMRIFPINKRGRAMGFIGLAMNFAPAIGPTLSGYIVTNFTWRYLFYMVAPLAILDVILASFLLKNYGETVKLKFDTISIGLSMVGMGALLAGLSNAGEGNWLSWSVIGLIFLGLAVLTYFVRRQMHRPTPLLNFKVFQYRNFTLAVITNVFVMMALYGGTLLLPLFIQNVQGQSAQISGLVLLPGALITAIMSPISGTLYDRYGAKYLSFIGLLILAISTFMFAQLQLATGLLYIIICQAVRNLAIGLTTMPLQTEALNALPRNLISHGSAMYTTIRQIAGSMGTACLITVMSLVSKASSHQAALAQLQGINTAYAVCGVLALVGAFCALKLVPRRNKAPQPQNFDASGADIKKMESTDTI
ncbi:multidrug transport protein [Agrilactobacillus composti DSM 18527 = JCM 14202]|uniref:Multidrug transport protein n=1 Tax=Agrilactobacillus composti DSM 18527 = JCM 14202 TaxID=1423734 RepID=X0PNM4_9LACO|nr:MDR family MFS transporter [Agrilactobacillus composti]KRM33130.1 multidrug transport protein [Agrilactobacillus composti DSM 18527 = JCM 14202]GAF38506.1 membrane component of multidrug resistance system [Agrilactobacillus composti DSM 18527 = JCM 14202]